jgi:hypothetical protein
VLVLNHQTNTHPLDRQAAPYSRREFFDALTFPILTTRQLFDWWRADDHEAVRVAVFGAASAKAAAQKKDPSAELPHQPQTGRRFFGRR